MGLQSNKREQTLATDSLWTFMSVSEYKKNNVVVYFLEVWAVKRVKKDVYAKRTTYF